MKELKHKLKLVKKALKKKNADYSELEQENIKLKLNNGENTDQMLQNLDSRSPRQLHIPES